MDQQPHQSGRCGLLSSISIKANLTGVTGRVLQLAAGTLHSMARTEDGKVGGEMVCGTCGQGPSLCSVPQVWVWGGNTEGQLGLGEEAEETLHHPTLLPFNQQVSLPLNLFINCPMC